MISPSSAFSTANAQLAKLPTYILNVGNYKRSFANRTGLSLHIPIQTARRVPGFGGLSLFNATLSLTKSVTAGDPIFVFIDYLGTFGQEVISSITDTGGHTWTSIFSDLTGTTTGVWYAIANANYPAGITISVNASNPGELRGGNFDLYAVEVSSAYSGFLSGSSVGTSTTASVTAGGTTVTYNTTAPGTSPWKLVLLELAPASGSTRSTTILFAVASSFPSGNTILSGGDTEVIGNGQVDDWIVNIDDLKISVSDLDGGSDLGDLVFNVQDFNQAITADLASFTFKGKACTLLAGFAGMTIDQFATLFTGVVTAVDSDNMNLEYKFTVSNKNLRKLAATIFNQSDADVNGNTFPVDSNHPHTILANPMDILVSALQQAGVALTDIDTAKIYFYRDTIFNGVLYEFSLTQAPIAKDFIESELMKPMGMYIWENNLGVLSINSFYPALSGNGNYTPPTYPQLSLDSSLITEIPIGQEAALIDQVTMRFDDNGNQFNAESVQTWLTATSKYGLVGVQIIESKGMRSSFQGYLWAAIVARLIFLRYGSNPIILDPVSLLWSACVVEPGDIDSLTLAFIPDRAAGVLGVTAQTFEIMDRNYRFMDGIVEVKLLQVNLSTFKQFLITPNGEADFASDTAPNQAKYMYQCNAAGKYSTGAAANTLG